jgi:pyrroloquinoline quinone biosynthesis protein E
LTVSGYTKIATLSHGIVRHLLARAAGKNACSSVTALLTVRCNCACGYCDFSRSHDGRELSTGEWLRLLDSLRRGGAFRLGLSGGEPLLRDDLGDIAHHAVSLGFKSSLVTNGIFLPDRVEEVLQLDYILCTIEGNERINDLQRGAGAWRASFSGLSALRTRGHRRLGVICPLHRQNLEVLEEPLRAAEQLGARAFFQPVQMREGWRGETFDALPSPEALREAFVRIRAWKRERRAVGNSMRYLDRMTGETVPGSGECYAGRYFFTLLPDGTLLPCCMVDWDRYGIAAGPDGLTGAVGRMRRPPCRGCSILPYLENTSLLKPHLPTVLDALGW